MRRRNHAPKPVRSKIILAFARARIERFEQVAGHRCALIPFRNAPDLNIGRETPLPDAQRADLLQRYVLSEGLPLTFRDDNGRTFFAVRDEQMAGAA